MKSKILLWTLLLPLSLLGQQAVLPSGGMANGNGSISYSVGEITYLTLVGDEGSVSSGIQQPFEISVVLETPETKMLTLVAYPNPTSDFVILQSAEALKTPLFFELYDLTGKLLFTEKFNGSETKIEMKSFAAATYFLKISSDTKIIKTFKILKK